MSGSRRPPPPPEKFSGGFFRQRPKDFLFTDLSDPPTHSLPRAFPPPSVSATTATIPQPHATFLLRGYITIPIFISSWSSSANPTITTAKQPWLPPSSPPHHQGALGFKEPARGAFGFGY
ncbi:hypothetical protein Tco_0391184 [Tanacetum coccineum]